MGRCEPEKGEAMNVLLKFFVLTACLSSQLLAQGKEDVFLAQGFKNYKGVLRFFDGLDREDIEALKYHESPKVASYAAWLSCQFRCETASPKSREQHQIYRREFLSFLSGRLNAPIPDWWGQDVIQLGTPEYRGPMKHKDEFIYDSLINRSKSLSVKELSSKRISVEFGGDKFETKWDQSDSLEHGDYELEDLKCISVKPISDDKFLVAISDDSKVLVCCVSRKQGMLWRNMVNSLAQKPLQGKIGSTKTVSELVVSKDVVHVFSLNLVGASIGSFDLTTGSDVLAFTTRYSLTENTGKVADQRRERVPE
jgi:hypothetical protein